MSLRNFIKRTQLLLDQALHESAQALKSEDAGPLRALDVTQLEERILMSASPLAAVAEAAQAAEAAVAEAPVVQGEGAIEPAEATAQDQQVLDVVAESVLPAAESVTDVTTEQTLELVFIDGSISNLEEMIADLESENALDDTRTLEIVVLDTERDGIAQVTSTLIQYDGIDGIHIVSHGRAGQVQLGSTTLSLETLDTYRSAITAWQHSMSEQADVLFYGCNLAATEDGRELMQQIAAECDCDVSASEDLTGHEELGGDWDLEYQIGDVESEIAFSDELIAGWYSTLDIASNSLVNIGFEEGSGTTAADSSGNNNNGTLTNSPTWTTDSAVGDHALDFTGDAVNSNATVQIPDDPSLNFNNDFSIAFWYKASTAQADGTRIVGSHDGSEGFNIYANADGSLNFFLDDGATTHTISAVGGFATDGDWHHVTATFEEDDEVMRIFVDGNVAASGSQPALGTITINAPITVGGENATNSDYEGLLDDFRVYERELVASDIAELRALRGITVDTTNDVVDGTTTDVASLLASKGADGFISLREAILAVNNDSSGTWTIEVGAGTYNISNGSGDSAGDFDIRNDVTIRGSGVGATIIDANSVDRVFQVHSSTVTFEDMTIQEGRGSSPGGAIHINAASDVTVNQVRLFDNAPSLSNGGAIHNSGTLTVTNSTFDSNDAPVSSGGAIYQASGGVANISNSLFVGNSASLSNGGAIYANGTLNVTNSTFSGNSISGFDNGSAIFINSAVATLQNVTVTGKHRT